ncbi:hypothetical protein HYPSUDRAFT_68302 [Hypholoma sublateritium FD-334 SS-4]|uniref:Uncharacterized protein n=1 Tax=Hypholoma sublateritium (strain FD-334 SS-4) TaxID=945553 RepID=A0A0D2MBG5_HYPSF|nr:hypothetical protein HYPSUDRAFT_68302 [Hypholoma sublateritium FD-334 SS-4]
MRKPKGRRKPRAKTADVRRVFPDGLVQYKNNAQSICIPTQPPAVQDVKLVLEARQDTHVYRDAGNSPRAPAVCSEKEDAADAFLDNLLSELLAKDECMLVDSIDNDYTECDAAAAITDIMSVFDSKVQVDRRMEVVDDFFAFTAKADVRINTSVLPFGRMETDNDFFVFNIENRISPHFLVFDFGQMEVDDGLFVFNPKTAGGPVSRLGQMEVDVNVPVCGCSQKKFDYVASVIDAKEEASREIYAFEYKMGDDDDLFFDAWSLPMEEIVDDYNSDVLRLELRDVVQSIQALNISDLDSMSVGFTEDIVDNFSIDDSGDSDVDDDNNTSDICLPKEEADHDFASDLFHHELANVIAGMQALHISGFESATSWTSITEPDCPSTAIAHATVDIHISEIQSKVEPVNNILSILSTDDALSANLANTAAEVLTTPSTVFKRESKEILRPIINMDFGIALQSILSGFDVKLSCTRKRRERKKRNVKIGVTSNVNATPGKANGIYAARCAASARTHAGRVTTRTHAEDEDMEQVVRMRFNEDEITILANVSNRLIASNARVSPWYTKQRTRKTESPIYVAHTQSILSTKRKATPPVWSLPFTSQEAPSSDINSPHSRFSSPIINANMKEDSAKEPPPSFLHPPSVKASPPLSALPSSKSSTEKTATEIPILSTSDTTRFTCFKSDEENVSRETTQPISSRGAALKIMPGAIANDNYHS